MSIGFKIKKLREDKNLSQPDLADILKISQSKLSNIENGQTKSIDFLLMDKVCHYFDKDFEFFTEGIQQINNVKRIDGSINNHGTINFFPENIISEIKRLIEELQKKEDLIHVLKEENNVLKTKNNL